MGVPAHFSNIMEQFVSMGVPAQFSFLWGYQSIFHILGVPEHFFHILDFITWCEQAASAAQACKELTKL